MHIVQKVAIIYAAALRMKSNLLRQVKTSSRRSKIMNKVALATQTSSCYLHTMSVDVLQYDCDTPPGLCCDIAALSKAQLVRFNGFPYTHRMVASLDRTTRHPLVYQHSTTTFATLSSSLFITTSSSITIFKEYNHAYIK
ncbi:predicted protein [Lichtheimia corymbifera JMRC:FSU:9682]|uniref:Uncharacterized protein n=1 Tax=Lichtheimia corymbifera JMRC:FSU:9682 TaxID=1263082 RepID=A0A068RRP2_9FUNG|nr:predicted protein [Lichtheimia corymbifera JMRC:FSU:9682]